MTAHWLHFNCSYKLIEGVVFLCLSVLLKNKKRSCQFKVHKQTEKFYIVVELLYAAQIDNVVK